MVLPDLIDVYALPAVDNVCNQILREVVSLSKASLAHVTMNPGNVSLLHQHLAMSEVYLILEGQGILYHGDKVLTVEKGAWHVLPPKIPHKLRNTGNTDLEHLVIAVPPFNPNDVHLLNEDSGNDAEPDRFEYYTQPITALDGAMIYEILSEAERKELGIGLAFGFLPAGRKAIPHYHKESEEVYYVTSGTGSVGVGERHFEVKKGSVIYIPRNAVHALENKSDVDELSVLCLSSPAYTNEDFILA